METEKTCENCDCSDKKDKDAEIYCYRDLDYYDRLDTCPNWTKIPESKQLETK